MINEQPVSAGFENISSSIIKPTLTRLEPKDAVLYLLGALQMHPVAKMCRPPENSKTVDREFPLVYTRCDNDGFIMGLLPLLKTLVENSGATYQLPLPDQAMSDRPFCRRHTKNV